MNDALRHRGPDDEGYYFGTGVGLGMRRLSIIDIAGGHQPIFNEDQSMCVVYNGEIYNYSELRDQLIVRGHVFQTGTDTEVIVHAYEEWGNDFVGRLNGMYALAIWNAKRSTLFLARDRIGEKPLYYWRGADQFIFASEIKALFGNSGVPRRLAPRGLANFLAFGHAVAPATMFEGIYKLLPGHYLEVSGGNIQVTEYWDVGRQSQQFPAEDRTMDGCARRVRELLDDSVQRRMVADVPVGAFLSGGVDSCAVVALMKRHASGPVKTFSLGFDLGGAYNELSEAAAAAQYLATEHHELQASHESLVEAVETLVYHYDEPFGDAAGFPTFVLSRFARQYVKVILAGDGADELFGGYRRYAADRFARAYQRLPGILTDTLLPAAVDRLPRLRRVKRSVRALPIRDPAARYAAWLDVFTPAMQQEILRPAIRDVLGGYDPWEPYRRYYQGLGETTARDHMNRLMYVDVKTLLADGYMEKLDKATMAASLEARLPMLDPRLVELAFQIPSRYKIHGRSTKSVLKRAVADLIPPAVLGRPKHGFAVPTDAWFRGGLKEYAFAILMDQRTRSRGYFEMPVIDRLWREHQDGRHVWDNQLWLLLNFELWHRMYLDGAYLGQSIPASCARDKS